MIKSGGGEEVRVKQFPGKLSRSFISIYQDQFKINSSGEIARQISENSQLKEEIRGGEGGKKAKRRGSR